MSEPEQRHVSVGGNVVKVVGVTGWMVWPIRARYDKCALCWLLVIGPQTAITETPDNNICDKLSIVRSHTMTITMISKY